jgi:hypothetical protein
MFYLGDAPLQRFGGAVAAFPTSLAIFDFS